MVEQSERLSFSLTHVKPTRSRFGRHPVSTEELSEINNYTTNLQDAAKYYADEIADHPIHFVYRDGNGLQDMQVYCGSENFIHLTGLTIDRQDAFGALDALVAGEGVQNDILIRDMRSVRSKLGVIDKLPDIFKADSLSINGIDSKNQRYLKFSDAIQTNDESAMLALSSFHPEILGPISFLNTTENRKYREVPKNTVLVVAREDPESHSVDIISSNNQYLNNVSEIEDLHQLLVSSIDNRDAVESSRVLSEQEQLTMKQEPSQETQIDSSSKAVNHDNGQLLDSAPPTAVRSTNQRSQRSGKKWQQQKTVAKNRNILDVAAALGMNLEHSGRTYKWTEHDSLVIFPKENNWKWFSQDKGGDVIALVQEVGGDDYKDFTKAVAFLNDPALKEADLSLFDQPKQPFDYKLQDRPLTQAAQYLSETRGISPATVAEFAKAGLLTEATRTHTNRETGESYSEPVAVFKSVDTSGKLVGATLQGVQENRERYAKHGYLKEIVANSDGNHGFSVDRGQPKRLIFFESPIDLMSYFDLKSKTGEINDARLVSMNGLKQNVVSTYFKELYLPKGKLDLEKGQTFLEGFDKYLDKTENPTERLTKQGIGITLAVDNDEAGRAFLDRLGLNHVPVKLDVPPSRPGQDKVDWNDQLKLVNAQAQNQTPEKAVEQSPAPDDATMPQTKQVPAITAEVFTDARMEQMQAVSDFWQEQLQKREPFSVVGRNKDGEVFRTQVFSPSTTQPGDFQLTYIDAQGQPVSHKHITKAMLDAPKLDESLQSELPSSTLGSSYEISYPVVSNTATVEQQPEQKPEPETNRPSLSDDQIKAWIEDEDLEFTDEPTESLFILRDGSMVSGGYDSGIRGEDHNSLTTILEDQGISFQDPEIWAKIHDATGVVRVVPESDKVLVMEGQELTAAQAAIIDDLQFDVEAYTQAPEYENEVDDQPTEEHSPAQQNQKTTELNDHAAPKITEYPIDRMTESSDDWKNRLAQSDQTELALVEQHVLKSADLQTPVSLTSDQQLALQELGQDLEISRRLEYRTIITPIGTEFSSYLLDDEPILVTPAGETKSGNQSFATAIGVGIIATKDYINEDSLANLSPDTQAELKRLVAIDPDYEAAIGEWAKRFDQRQVSGTEWIDDNNTSMMQYSIGTQIIGSLPTEENPDLTDSITQAVLSGKLDARGLIKNDGEYLLEEFNEGTISAEALTALEDVMHGRTTENGRNAAVKFSQAQLAERHAQEVQRNDWEQRLAQPGTTELGLLQKRIERDRQQGVSLNSLQHAAIVKELASKIPVKESFFETPIGTSFYSLTLNGKTFSVQPASNHIDDPQANRAYQAQLLANALNDGDITPQQALTPKLISMASGDSRDLLNDLIKPTESAKPSEAKTQTQSVTPQDPETAVQPEPVEPTQTQPTEEAVIHNVFLYYEQDGQLVTAAQKLNDDEYAAMQARVEKAHSEGKLVLATDSELPFEDAKVMLDKQRQNLLNSGIELATAGDHSLSIEERMMGDKPKAPEFKLEKFDPESVAKQALEMVRQYTKTPEQLNEYLDFMSNFPGLSPRNVALVKAQWEGAQAVGTFKQWQQRGKDLNLSSKSLMPTVMRTASDDAEGVNTIDDAQLAKLSVMKGEKAKIVLVRPQMQSVIKVPDKDGKIKEVPRSEATKEQKDAADNGKLKTSIEARKDKTTDRTIFTTYKVFEITQTNLAPDAYPKLMPNRKYDFNVDKVQGRKLLDGLREHAKKMGVPVQTDHNDELGSAKGSFSTWHVLKGDDGKPMGEFDADKSRILLNPRNSLGQNIATLAHELTHATLHNASHDKKGAELPRERMELEAELSSYVVANRFGLDTSQKAVGYMAEWTDRLSALTPAELSQSMNRATGAAKQMIQTVETSLPPKPLQRGIAPNFTRTQAQAKPVASR